LETNQTRLVIIFVRNHIIEILIIGFIGILIIPIVKWYGSRDEDKKQD